MRRSTRFLKHLSIPRLEELIRQKKREAKLAPLERERTQLLGRLQRIEIRIVRLQEDGGARKPRRRKRQVSAATRRKMAAAQQARWAKKNGATQPKRRYSAEARKRMAEGARKRWAKGKVQRKQVEAAHATA